MKKELLSLVDMTDLDGLITEFSQKQLPMFLVSSLKPQADAEDKLGIFCIWAEGILREHSSLKVHQIFPKMENGWLWEMKVIIYSWNGHKRALFGVFPPFVVYCIYLTWIETHIYNQVTKIYSF